MITKEAFSIRLKELRLERNMTQKELAKELSVSMGSIGFYENKERTPDIEFLMRAVDFFGVSADYLLGLQEERHNEDIQSTRDLGLSEKSIIALESYKADEVEFLAPIINLLLEEVYDSIIELEYPLEYPYVIRESTVLDALSNYYCVNLSPDKDEYLQIRRSGLIGTDDYLPGGKYDPDLGNHYESLMTVDAVSKNELIEKVLMEKVQEQLRELRKKVEQSRKGDLNGNDTEKE